MRIFFRNSNLGPEEVSVTIWRQLLEIEGLTHQAVHSPEARADLLKRWSILKRGLRLEVASGEERRLLLALSNNHMVLARHMATLEAVTERYQAEIAEKVASNCESICQEHLNHFFDFTTSWQIRIVI